LIGIKTPGFFGKRFTIPSAYTKRHEIHTYFLGSAFQHLGLDKRTKSSELVV
jgi:hypothetical protein